MKTLNRLLLSVLILYPLLSGMACQPVAEPLPPKTASLRTDKNLGVLNPNLFGTNLQWEHSGDGLLQNTATEKPDFDRQALSSAKGLKISSIRFPGGSLANTYDWEHGIGPSSKRKAGTSFAGKPAPSHFGTDELLALSKQMNASPVLTVNLNWSQEHAKAWVDYVLKKQKQNNDKKFATYWELGNELYNPHEPGHSTAVEYANRANSMARALKQNHPNIKTGAILEISFLQAAWMGSVFPHMTTWNEEVIKNLSKDIDFVSVHFYAPYDKLWDSGQLSQLTLAGPIVFRQNVRTIQGLLQKYKRTDLEIAVTEYNTFFGDKIKLDPRTGGTEAALFNALMLMEMASLPEVSLANHWSLVNNSVFGLIETNGQGAVSNRPSFDIFHTLSNQAGYTAKSVAINGPTYAVSAIGNIPSIADVPIIKALITTDRAGKKYLNIVNRSWNQPVRVHVADLTGTPSIRLSQWSGYGVKNWKKSVINQSMVLEGGQLTIPAHSFTKIEW